MKRVLTAAVFGGLMIFGAPHGAWADHAPDHQGSECGAKTEKADSDEHAPEQQRQGDHEQKGGDDSEILF
jgi:hypothetical protein